MKLGELISIKTLDENSSSTQNDKEKHTPYKAELRLFSCIQLGDSNRLMDELEKIDLTIIAGKMSDNSLMQYKYLAVSIIALAIRYAIQGGLNEKIAYGFADNAICTVDKMDSDSQILFYIADEILLLTEMVKKSKESPIQSPHIKKCIRYINANTDKKITVSSLADLCGISPDYLSHIFRAEMGEKLSTYILKTKTEKSKELLLQGKSYKEICDLLGFSTSAHYTSTFRRFYNMTPSEYSRMIK